MRLVRSMSVAERSELYLDKRLVDQANWYRRKSAEYRAWATRWFWLSLGLQIAAAAAAILAITGFSIGGFTITTETWLGVVAWFGAFSLAGTALVQLNRYDETAKAYAIALQEVVLVADLARTFKTDAELSTFVSDGEDAISREHKMWIAKRSASDGGSIQR
jgi:hypothetical protein